MQNDNEDRKFDLQQEEIEVNYMQRRSTVESTRSNGLNTIHISKRLIICSANAKINTSRKLLHVYTGCTRSRVTLFCYYMNEMAFVIRICSLLKSETKKRLRVEEGEPPVHSSTGEQTIA